MSKTVSANQPLRLKEQYTTEVVPVLQKEFKLTNILAVPRIKKVVINMGVTNPLELGPREQAIANIVEQFHIMTGQHPQVTKATKAISGFKLRAGDPVGVMVTLRGQFMWEFLDKLIAITLPRVKDFRGVPRKTFDGRGNYSLGLEEQIVFPEISYDKIERVRGLQINIVMSSNSNEQSFRLLELLGMPFEKVESK